MAKRVAGFEMAVLRVWVIVWCIAGVSLSTCWVKIQINFALDSGLGFFSFFCDFALQFSPWGRINFAIFWGLFTPLRGRFSIFFRDGGRWVAWDMAYDGCGGCDGCDGFDGCDDWINIFTVIWGDLGCFLCIPIPLGVGFCCDGCDGCDGCGVFVSPWPPSRPIFRKYFLLMMRVHTMNLCPYVLCPDPFLESFPSAYRCIYMMYILFYYLLLFNITF